MSLFTEYDEFSKCVKRYKGDRHAIKFTCRDQFMAMMMSGDCGICLAASCCRNRFASLRRQRGFSCKSVGGLRL